MAKPNTTKTVYYRRCLIASDQKRDLQQLIGAALVTHPKPGGRYEPLNSQSTELRCIGKHSTISNCLCGYVTSFERGAAQPVVADDPAAASLQLGALAPPQPKKGQASQQYVPGVIYFVIHKNHVAFVSTHAMRSSALEAHFNWLLKSRTTELDATVPFSLSDEAQKVTKEKIKKSHVRSIAIGQPLMSEVGVPAVIEQDGIVVGSKKQTKKAQSAFKPQGPMLELIRNLFDDENEFEKLGLDEVFDGNLEVWIEIRYPKRKRSRPEDAVKLMDTLGVALRDIEGDQVSLELENGHRVSGKDLKISGTVDVTPLQHNLPDQDKLWSSMISWLNAQITNGVIDP